MDTFWLLLGWIGIYAPTAIGAVGSIVGCARAGQAACGAMLDVESGYGRLVGLSALPSSQIIYGIVVMFTLNREVTTTNAPGLFAIGVLCGGALLASAMFQGACCASAINASKNKPEIFGLSAAPAAIVEGFAVFAFIFALVVAGGIKDYPEEGGSPPDETAAAIVAPVDAG
jgi:V/A-type H+-transporting ATPase subunit K